MLNIKDMIKNLNDDLNFLSFSTILSLVDVDRIMDSTSYILLSGGITLIAGILIYALSIIIFNKKSLTI